MADAEKAKSNPCEKEMNAYLKCVESKKNGMQGDECMKETDSYKLCRAKVKLASQAKR